MNIKYVSLLSLILTPALNAISFAEELDTAKKEWHHCLKLRKQSIKEHEDYSINCSAQEKSFEDAKENFLRLMDYMSFNYYHQSLDKICENSQTIGQEQTWQEYQFNLILGNLARNLFYELRNNEKSFNKDKRSTQEICSFIIDEREVSDEGFFQIRCNKNFYDNKISKVEHDKARQHLKDIIKNCRLEKNQ